MKKFLSFAVVVAMVLSVSVCMALAEPYVPGSKEGPYVVGFSEVWESNTWAAQAKAEIEEAMVTSPDVKEYFITNSEGDGAKQVADIEDLLTKGIDLLVLQPINPEALTPVIEKAYDAGVVVVPAMLRLETDKYSAYIESDEVGYGTLGAEWLVEKLDGKGKIIILDGAAGVATSEIRTNAALAVFEKYPEIEVVGREYGDWDYAKGREITEQLLAANPQIDGVWSGGGDMTRGAIDAFKAARRPLVPMTGEDSNGLFKTWNALIEEGETAFECCAVTTGAWMYRAAFELGIQILKGEEVAKDTTSPQMLLTTVEDVKKNVRNDLSDSFWLNSRLSDEKKLELFGVD